MGQRVTPIPHIQSSAVWRQLSWSLNTHPESEVKIHSHRSTPPGSSLPCLPALSANTGSFHLLYLTHNWMARCPAPPAHRLLILAGLPHQPDCKPQESREQPDCGEVSDLTLRWWRRKSSKETNKCRDIATTRSRFKGPRFKPHRTNSNSLNPSKSCSKVGVSNIELSQCAVSLQAVKQSKEWPPTSAGLLLLFPFPTSFSLK